MEKLRIIDGEYDDWVSLTLIDNDTPIAETVQVIYCDTRDFAIGWDFKQPEKAEKAECGFERGMNEELSKLEQLYSADNPSNYIIPEKEIVGWLKTLCEKSGGFNTDWRYLSADVRHCDGWELKYIRFIRHRERKDAFIVCNDHYRPIPYKEIIGNLKDVFADL